MKNKIKFLFVLIVTIFNYNNVYSAEDFIFNITEIEILQEGNLFKGLKRGTATTNEGLEITADEFEYDKSLNILNAKGKVEIKDDIIFYIVFNFNFSLSI